MKNWIKENKIVLFITVVLLMLIIAGSLFYLLYGHKLVESWYKGEPVLFWHGFDEDQVKQPLAHYIRKADTKFMLVCSLGLISTLCIFLFGIWIRHLTLKKVMLTMIVFFGLIFGLFLLNGTKIGIFAFQKSLHRLLEKSEQIIKKAESFNEEKTLMNLRMNSLNTFYYRFDERIKDAIFEDRNSDNNRKSLEPKGYNIEFDAEDADKFRLKKGEFFIENGLLRLRYEKGDHLENAQELAIDKERIGDIEIRIRLKKGKRIWLGWSKDINSEWGNEDLVGIIALDTIPDDSFHIYSINAQNALKRRLEYGDIIKKIFLVPSNAPGDEIEIDYIRFNSKKTRYINMPFGQSYETINNEMRKVLYINTPCVFRYSIYIPKSKTFLSFGLGVLEFDDPIKFIITAKYDNIQKELFTSEISDNNLWRDVKIDLSDWAGKEIEISFKAESKQGNIGFWSNPILYVPPGKKFNVIMVLEDALRADHMSCYGYFTKTTPFKDELIKEGILFLNAFSQGTVTRVSCPAFMTSLYPSTTGVWNFHEMLDDRYLTLAEIMRQQGFVTASFIQNGNAGPYAGLHQGFSFLFDEESVGFRAEEMYGKVLYDWLDENKERNAFIYLHLRDPHDPYDPPSPFDDYFKKSKEENIISDQSNVETSRTEERRRLYDGEVSYNDYYFRQFLEQLKKYNLFEDTLIVFIADHGEHLGEHSLWGHFPPGYIQVTQVPLLMIYPKLLPKNKEINQLVQLIDIMPTILDLANIDKDKFLLQGESMLSLLQGKSSKDWENRSIICEEVSISSKHDKREWASIFYRNRHIINSKSFINEMRPILLPRFLDFASLRVFDFVNDKQEYDYINSFFVDLVFKFRIKHFIRRFQNNNMKIWRLITGGTQEKIKLDPQVQERLKALGYIK